MGCSTSSLSHANRGHEPENRPPGYGGDDPAANKGDNLAAEVRHDAVQFESLDGRERGDASASSVQDVMLPELWTRVEEYIKCPWEVLPSELWRMVAEHLDPLDVISLVSASRPIATFLNPTQRQDALVLASLLGKVLVVLRLIRAGADKDGAALRYGEGLTPLGAAVRGGHERIIEMLVASKVDVNNRFLCWRHGIRNWGWGMRMTTPLIMAAGGDAGIWMNQDDRRRLNRNRSSIVKTLLEHGCDVNLADEDGTTPLIYAAHYGLSKIVKMLLAANADKTSVDFEGKTVLQRAEEKLQLESDPNAHARLKKVVTLLRPPRRRHRRRRRRRSG